MAAAGALSAIIALVSPARADIALNFDATNPLGSTVISGDKANAVTTTTFAQSAPYSLAYQDNSPERADAFTYDLPNTLTAGTVSVWFYDTLPTATPVTNKWGLSIILEDKNNQADFGAVEVADISSAGGRRYYGSEGSTDRLTTGKWDTAALPVRSVGWHQVVFTVGATQSTISVDGSAATVAAAPGGDKTLRLRIGGFSPSLGGTDNYVTNLTGDTHPAGRNLVYIDDISFVSTAPAATSYSDGFEIVGGVPSYDVPTGETIAKHDNTYTTRFVNVFQINTNPAYVHSGTQSASFNPGSKRFRSIAFDLSTASPNTTATIWFYDSLGQDAGQNKFGGSIVLEDGTNPANWVAAEIWNFSFPVGQPAGQYRYYGTSSFTVGGKYYDSWYYGLRSIGWHRVDVVIGATQSHILIDGLENQKPAPVGVKYGPGLDKSPKLRILFDSAAVGSTAGLNWRTVGELDALYDDNASVNTPYLYFDNITLPLPATAAVEDWSQY